MARAAPLPRFIVLSGVLALSVGTACSGAKHDMAPRDAGSQPPEDAGPGPVSDAEVQPPVPDAGADAGPVRDDCPTSPGGSRIAQFQASPLEEASGLAVGRRNPELLWLHNDAGDSARIFAFDRAGRLRAEVQVQGAEALDWEDMVSIAGAEPGAGKLYVADIGDNDGTRASVQLYRIEEPTISADGEPAQLSVAGERIEVTYPGGAHDAETLLADPGTGDLYVVGKRNGKSGGIAQVPVFRLPAAALASGQVAAERIATIGINDATGGAFLPDGSGIAVRSYELVQFWPRTAVQSVAEALAGEPCPLPLSEDDQGEALTFAADGSGYFTTIEEKKAPLFFYAFDRK